MKRFLPVILIALAFHAKAQFFVTDTTWFKSEKIHYLGVQSNQLLQQFISFNSNSSINSNPYLFSYSKINQSGRGFGLGTGLSVSQNSTNDGVAAVTVQNTNVSLRVGWEKKYMQRSRFIPFLGMDGGFGVLFNRTTSSLNQSFNNNRIEIETWKFFLGPSFRGGLDYAITKHVLIGTEFFFNLHLSYAETNVNNGGFFGETSSEFAPFNIGFQPPTAVFLMFRY